jgi:hypothetical protein
LYSHYYVEESYCATLVSPTFSIPADTDYPATNALDGLQSMSSDTGTGITWTADINRGPALVLDVTVNTSIGYRLSSVNVLVDDILCG